MVPGTTSTDRSGPEASNSRIEQINASTGTTYYLHEDVNGSVIAITDSTGHTVGSFSYDPYGNLNGESGTVTSPLGFASGYLDSSTGLYYLINRYYDPSTAQFLSIDPLVASTGQPYQYAGDDPVNEATRVDCAIRTPLVAHSRTQNCLSGAVPIGPRPNGGGSESVGGIVKSVGALAGAVVVGVAAGAYVYAAGSAYLARGGFSRCCRIG